MHQPWSAAAALMLLFLPTIANAAGATELNPWLRRVQAARGEPLGTQPAAAPSSAELQAELEEGELLLIFGPSSGERLAVAALRTDGAVGPLEIDLEIDSLASEVERVHTLLRSGSRPARGQLLRLTDALGDVLLEPVSSLLANADSVRLLTAPPLDQLPFAALRLPRSVDERRRHLVAQVELCHLVDLSPRPAANRARARILAAADPEFRRSERPLGASMSDAGVSWRRSASRRLEIQALGEAFSTTKQLSGTGFTRRSLREAGSVDLLHLAADVELGGEFSRASLALSAGDPGAPPDRLPLRDAERWLTSEGGLAVLTGLSMSRSELSAGEENARNFLTAEASEQSLHSASLLAAALQRAGFLEALTTLWLAPDESSPAFFRSFYRALASGASAGSALRTAQLRMIESPIDAGGGVRLDAREPLFWAGFRLYSTCR